MLYTIIGSILLYIYFIWEYIKIETKPAYKQDILSVIIFTLLFVFTIIGVDLFKSWPYIIGYIVLVVIGIIITNKLLNKKKTKNTKESKPKK